MDSLIIAVFIAVFGGIFSAFLGWAESGDALDPRKLFCALVRGGMGGALVAYLFVVAHPVLIPIDFLVLCLMAMGLDVGVNTGWKIVRNTSEKASTPG